MKQILSLAILLILIGCNSSEGGSSEKAFGENSTVPVQDETTISKFMTLVNNHRKGIGLKALIHAEEMAI